MLFYSSLYKRYFPFSRSTEIQQLEDRDRDKMVKYIRHFPAMVNYWEIHAEHNAVRGTMGSTCYLRGLNSKDILPTFAELANKVLKRHELTEEEVLAVNMALCAHKYNWFWKSYIHPVRDIVELCQKYSASKKTS